MLRPLAVFLLLVTAASPAPAAPPKDEGAAGASPCDRPGRYCASIPAIDDAAALADAEMEQWKVPEGSATLALPIFPIPLVSGERLLGYVFVTPRLVFPGLSDVLRLENGGARHALMDELIHAAHAAPAVEGEGGEPDLSALQARWTEIARARYPRHPDVEVQMLGGDIRRLRP